MHAVDGSGLTRSQPGSPLQVVRFLEAMRTEPRWANNSSHDLALAGHEGTVADRMRGTAADGRCRTKTGTLTGVSNLSGYCFNRDGRVMIFSILMNGVRDLDSPTPDQDRIAAAVAGYERRRGARAGRAFVEDLVAELLRLGQLRSGAVAGDDVVGLLRHRIGRPSPRPS